MCECLMTNCKNNAPSNEAMCSKHREHNGLSGNVYRDLSNLAARVARLEYKLKE